MRRQGIGYLCNAFSHAADKYGYHLQPNSDTSDGPWDFLNMKLHNNNRLPACPFNPPCCIVFPHGSPNRFTKKIGIICLLLGMAIIGSSCDSRGSIEPQPQVLEPQVIGNGLSGPQAVVTAFCDFDARGKRFFRRLSDKEISYYKGLVHWSEEPDWNTIVIIKNYRLAEIKKDQDAAEIAVTYHIQAGYSAGHILVQEKVEKIKFQLIKTNAGWKIESPAVYPHMYSLALVKKLENRMRHEIKSANRVKIQHDIDVIKNLKYFSFEKNTGLY
jgi:hypothetical protein